MPATTLLERLEPRRLMDAGDLDPTFGQGGTASPGYGFHGAKVLEVYPDGRVLAAGGGTYGGGDMELARFVADGSLDRSFAGSGTLKVDFGGKDDEPYDLALQADGKILVAGRADFGVGGPGPFAVLRLNPDGTRDTPFGNARGAFVLGERQSVYTFEGAYALAPLPDGKVLAAGYLLDVGSVVVRLLPDGTLDLTFGGGDGIEVLPNYVPPQDIALLPDGRFLVGMGPEEQPSLPGSGTGFQISRRLPDGSPDPSFGGGDGLVVGPAGWSLTSIALQGDGRIVASGSAENERTDPIPPGKWALFRFLSDGTADPTLDGDGYVTTVFANSKRGDAADVVVQPDGKLLAVGTYITSFFNMSEMAVVRYNADGSLDTGFGRGDGKTIIRASGANDVALYPGDRAVVAGYRLDGVAGMFFVDRYQLDWPPGAHVIGRHVFYNNSAFDGRDPSAGASDDAAVATDKLALRRGDAWSGAVQNVTSYARGLNGIMIDIVGLPAGVTLSPDDFSFRTTPTHEWRALGDAGVGVSLRRGAGLGGSDRVTLVWPDYDPGAPAAGRAVANAWLEVTVKATAATGLPWPDVFYFGNLVAESGDGTEPSDLNIRVTATDVARTRASLLSAGPITNPFDYNRDGRVNVTDVALVRSNVGRYIEKVGIGGPGPTAAASLFTRAAPRRRRAFDGLSD